MKNAKANAHLRTALNNIRSQLVNAQALERTYKPRACLSEDELLTWEEHYGVELPEEYRLFLNEIGDGGMMPGSYCDFVIHPLAKVWGAATAATPFPITTARLKKRFRQLEKEGRPADGIIFPELTVYWEDDKAPPGCLMFGHYPSYDWLFLVTTGELRGTIWCGVSDGVPEQAKGAFVSFLPWFAAALAEFLEIQ